MLEVPSIRKLSRRSRKVLPVILQLVQYFFHTFLVWGWLDGKLSLERSIEKLLGTHHDESKHLCEDDGQACASAGSIRPCPSSELES